MKLEILFPELCCLYGDAVNAEYLMRAVPELETVRTPLSRTPAFTESSDCLVYLGSMTERAQELAVKALAPHKDRLRELIGGGSPFLVTGNAIELFGKYIEEDDGKRTEMLGLFDFYIKRRMMERYNSIFLGRFGETDIVGFMSRFGHMYGEPGDALFETIKGAGHAPGDVSEGLCLNNFMATYVLGPLLVLNPPFTKRLLETLGFPGREIPFEKAAMDAYGQRLKEFKDQKTVVVY